MAVVASLLRFWGSSWGSPYEYHPDEHRIFNPALSMVLTRDPDPHRFDYPSLLTDVEATAIWLEHRVSGWSLEPNVLPRGADPGDILPALFHFVETGRAVVGGLGVLSCLLVSVGLRRLGVGWTGVAMGGMALAAAPLAVSNAHFLTTDVPSSVGSAMAIACAVGMVGPRRRIDAFLTGVGVGLAASAKYNAVLIGAVPILLLWLRPRPTHHGIRDGFLVLLGAALGFGLTSPFVILDYQRAVADILAQLAIYSSGHLGAQGTANWLWYSNNLLFGSWGLVPSLVSVIGVGTGIAMARFRAMSLSLLGFLLIYVAVIGSAVVRFDRNLLPVLPGLAFTFGLAVDSAQTVGYALLRRIVKNPRVLRVIAPIILLALLLPSVATDVNDDRQLTLEDSRTRALSMMIAALPPGARVVREWYTPQLEWTSLQSLSVGSIGDYSVDWYRANGYHYVVVSSYMYERFLSNDAAPPDHVKVYREIFAMIPILSLDPDDELRGPKIRVYNLDR